MGDSDDEQYDRNRRRDKFARERRDYDDSGRRRDWNDGGDGRSSWASRSSGRDSGYGRDSYGRRDRYGSPRGDRGDMSPPNKRSRRDWDDRYSSYDQGSHDHRSTSSSGALDKCPTQPRLVPFKEFLHRLDDDVDEADAVRKYNEYKIDFKKKQIKEFFEKHKDEEWFKIKYHPDERPAIQSEKQEYVKKRLEVFKELLASGVLDSTPADVENSNKIIRILDSAVIKLEGGTGFDLEVLDQPEEEVKVTKPEVSLFSIDTEDGQTTKTETAPEAPESDCKPAEAQKPEATNVPEEVKENGTVIKKEDGEEATESHEVSNASTSVAESEATIDPSAAGEEIETAPEKPQPCSLHKTSSIFLRNLPPSITRAEIIETCQDFPGFLRVAIAEPQVERHFYRRGWVTFKKDVNIKEICWEVDKKKFQETACGAIVNRELTRRIRSVNGVASHKNVVRADIRHAAKIIYNLDRQKGLWSDSPLGYVDAGKSKSEEFAEESKNPLLQNIKEYLIEEANAEEEELLGVEAGELEEGEEGGQSLERDDQLIKILDRMLYYLRIVHSIDYYQATDYPQEDFMPNRIGIMHARGSPPSSKVTSSEVNNYIKSFEEKIRAYAESPSPVTEDEAKQLGILTTDEAVEVLIKNTINMLKPGKYECKMEGKKFKGEEFVVKHIRAKHEREIENVRKEAECFANYIKDPKRPSLPEHPSNRPQAAHSQQTPRDQPVQGLMPPTGPWGPPPGAFGQPAFGYGYSARPPMPYGMPPMGGFPGAIRGAFPGRGRGLRPYNDLDDPHEY